MRTLRTNGGKGCIFNIGDEVTTDFFANQKNVKRRVTHILPWHSQSGWRVTTEDETGRALKIDAAWYKKFEPSV